MKKAFAQNGRRNIAVVVDLLFPQREPMRHRYFRIHTSHELQLGAVLAGTTVFNPVYRGT